MFTVLCALRALTPRRTRLFIVSLATLISLCLPVSLFIPVAPIVAAGNTYFVSASGNDANPGTRSQPWRTIQKAANVMQPGDSCTVLPGDCSSERVQVTKSGRSGAPISFAAEGTVTMKGFTVKANYVTVKGFDISNTPNAWDNGWGVFVQGSNCVVEGNYVHYATRGGIILYAAPGSASSTSNCVVRNNRLYRNSQAGVEVYGRNNLIEGNEISHTIQNHPQWTDRPYWVDADGIRFFGAGHTIRKNNIHDITYKDSENASPHIDCFQTWNDSSHEVGHDILFEQNVCKNLEYKSATAAGQGFMVQDSASGLRILNNVIQAFRLLNMFDSSNLTVANNTFASSLSFAGLDPGGIHLTRCPNAVVKNNVFYNVGASGPPYLSVDSASKSGLDAGYNLAYMSDGSRLAGTPYPHDVWKANPLFVNAGTGNFHLQTGSPAIDAGINLSSVRYDFDGNVRPAGLRHDIGAYEAGQLAIMPLETYLPLVVKALSPHR